MAGLVVWVTAATSGNKANCRALKEFVVVGALGPCGWCWGNRETRSRSSFQGGVGVLNLYPSFSIQKVHCCAFPGVVGTTE